VHPIAEKADPIKAATAHLATRVSMTGPSSSGLLRKYEARLISRRFPTNTRQKAQRVESRVAFADTPWVAEGPEGAVRLLRLGRRGERR
jgi:hypothetical protein